MEAIRRYYRDLTVLPEIRFIIRFLLLFVGLYCAAYFFVGITIKGGFYSPFVIENLNGINWLKASILYTANTLTTGFGLDTYVLGNTLRITNGSWVFLGYSCLGLGVLAFWSAFTLAQDMPLKRKLSWMVGGVLFIWTINCIRVAVLVAAIANKWPVIKNMDHHLTFNILSYILIFLMIYFFYRKNKDLEVQGKPE